MRLGHWFKRLRARALALQQPQQYKRRRPSQQHGEPAVQWRVSHRLPEPHSTTDSQRPARDEGHPPSGQRQHEAIVDELHPAEYNDISALKLRVSLKGFLEHRFIDAAEGAAQP